MELHDLLGAGLEPNDLTSGQVALRAVVIYLATLGIVRVAKRRFLGRATAFDVVVGIIIGSIASRAITGNAPMLPSMAACTAIVAMHWLFSGLAVRWHAFGEVIKGSTRVLIRDGAVDEKALRDVHMTHRDLDEALRQEGHQDAQGVAEARLERNGSVSVIEKK